MSSDDFYSVSGNQGYIKYIIKKHETLTTIAPTHAYIIRINNRLVFKRKRWILVRLSNAWNNEIIW